MRPGVALRLGGTDRKIGEGSIGSAVPSSVRIRRGNHDRHPSEVRPLFTTAARDSRQNWRPPTRSDAPGLPGDRRSTGPLSSTCPGWRSRSRDIRPAANQLGNRLDTHAECYRPGIGRQAKQRPIRDEGPAMQSRAAWDAHRSWRCGHRSIRGRRGDAGPLAVSESARRKRFAKPAGSGPLRQSHPLG